MPPGNDRSRLPIGILLLALAAGLAGCVEPIQSGGVVMYGGEGARVAAMCRFRRGTEGKAGFCAPETEAPAAVVVSRVEERNKPSFAGALVEAKAGDVLLDNGAIAAVIGASDGALVDAADAAVREDALGRVTTCLGAPLGCLTGVAISAEQGRDGSASVLARGHAEGDPRVTIATRYMLVPGARVLLVSTIVSSKADEPVVIPSLGDAVHWGSAEALPAASAVAEAPFVAALGSAVAYAIAPADDRPTLEVEATAAATSLRFGRDVTLPPGGSARYERLFVVAPRGDTLGVLTELALVREERVPGAIELRFVDEAGKPLPPPEGARVELVSSRDTLGAFLRIGRSVSEAGVAAEAPPGVYELDLRGKGLRSLARIPIEVRSGEVTQATITVGPEASPVPAPVAPEGTTPSP